MVKFRGIAGRWMLNGIAVVLVVVIVGVSTFALAALNYYYSAVRMSLMTKPKPPPNFSPPMCPEPTPSITRAPINTLRILRIKTGWNCSL